MRRNILKIQKEMFFSWAEKKIPSRVIILPSVACNAPWNLQDTENLYFYNITHLQHILFGGIGSTCNFFAKIKSLRCVHLNNEHNIMLLYDSSTSLYVHTGSCAINTVNMIFEHHKEMPLRNSFPRVARS